MYETVVIDYQVGVVTDRYEKYGVEYAAVNVRGANKVVRECELVTLETFLSLARAAELEACDWCRGTGRINPIENPPYSCDHCGGRGYFVAQERRSTGSAKKRLIATVMTRSKRYGDVD